MSPPDGIRRKDPCPCGSGKRYKRCCGAESGAASAAAGSTIAPQTSRVSAPATRAAADEPDRSRATALCDYHLSVLFDGVKVGGLDFYATYRACMEASRTEVRLWKALRRAQRAYNLARYFYRTLLLPGARAECGVLRGFSALLVSKVARSVAPDSRGAGLHLVDSFEGLSRPGPHDAIGTDTLPDGSVRFQYGARQGDLASPLERARDVLREFPEITFHKGWIPEVLHALPETPWAFVHIDVDLYDPTLACLEYFVPRMAPGGIIVNDDYASPVFPGGGRAWDDYCGPRQLITAALDTGQAVLVKGA